MLGNFVPLTKRKMKNLKRYNGFISIGILGLALLPFMSPSIALALGIGLSLLGLTNEWLVSKSSLVLKTAIVMMGFGMNLLQVIQVSKSGFLDTAVSVISVMVLGVILGWVLKVDKRPALLISTGTAICGGSAIAAVAPVLGAKNSEISFSLVVIFVLNAIALFLFPFLGHYLGLTQTEFGYWAAIAIHDTSSLVGAGAVYGDEALHIATTVKLVRTLWIIPITLVLAFMSRGDSNGKVKIPWFIGLFIVAILVSSLFPDYRLIYNAVFLGGKKLMIMALFLIGSSISLQEAMKVGIKGFLLGISLWVLIGTVSLIFFLH